MFQKIPKSETLVGFWGVNWRIIPSSPSWALPVWVPWALQPSCPRGCVCSPQRLGWSWQLEGASRGRTGSSGGHRLWKGLLGSVGGTKKENISNLPCLFCDIPFNTLMHFLIQSCWKWLDFSEGWARALTELNPGLQFHARHPCSCSAPVLQPPLCKVLQSPPRYHLTTTAGRSEGLSPINHSLMCLPQMGFKEEKSSDNPHPLPTWKLEHASLKLAYLGHRC